MKKILTLAAAALISLSAMAESDIFENPDNAPRLGARVAIDISSAASGNDYYSNSLGFTAGAVYNIPVYKNLYVEPGLSIFYNTFGMDVPEINTPGVPETSFISGSIRNWGFRVPIVAGYFFDFTDDIRIAPFIGPQLNVSFYAHEKLGSLDSNIFGEGGFRHADLQLAFGLGVTYQRYYVSISGGVGLSRARDLKFDNFRRNDVAITLGYNF